MKKLILLMLIITLAAISATGQQFGNAIHLDGVNDYLVVPHNNILNPGNGSWSVVLWIKAADKPQVSPIVMKRFPDSPYTQYSYGFGKDDPHNPEPGKRLRVNHIESAGVSERSGYATPEVVDGNWHHVAFIANKNENRFKIYVDGEKLDFNPLYYYGSWPNVSTNTDLFIGRGSSNSSRVEGLLDELSIWNKALTKTQIQKMMADTLSPAYYHTADSGLVAYYRFDQFEDLLANNGAHDFRDLSVYENHASADGAPGLVPSFYSGSTKYVDAGNETGLENGSADFPFNTIEEGITNSKTGDTIFVKPGSYSPAGSELILRPGTILIGENQENTIINADIIDTTNNELPFEIHNLTFREFYCSRGTNLTAHYNDPCQIKNNICQYISIGHGGGYIENGDDLLFFPIPFFQIENNIVSGEITFNHGAGKIVGRNIIRNNTAEIISLKHGAVTAPLDQPDPGYGYLIENNDVREEIAFNQGAGADSTMTEIIQNLIKIVVSNNKAGIIGISCGAGYTYIIDNNTIKNGIIDASGGCWTTISNNTITNGQIVDKSSTTNPNFWECETPDCMIEDQFIENNTIYFEATGDPDEAFAIVAKSSSVTIRGNNITCKGATSGIQLESGNPTNVIDNVITVEPSADFGIETKAGYGVVTGNKITGGKVGYYSSSGAVLFEENTITGSHRGFYSGGLEEVKNNTISNCTGYGMVIAGMRGPISGNTIINNDSTGIWVMSGVDLGGGNNGTVGENIIRGNGYYDMRISINTTESDTLFINNNVWDHETIDDILNFDILNENTNGKLFVDLSSIIVKPRSPRLTSPANNANPVSANIQFLWEPVENANYYCLQVATEPGFINLIAEFDSLLVSGFIMEGFSGGTEYFWRVKSVNLAGESEWSETWQFNFGTASGLTNTGKSVQLKIFPNPASNELNIVFPQQDNEFTLTIYDLTGRVILERKGFGNNRIDISELNAGIYSLKIQIKNKNYYATFLKK